MKSGGVVKRSYVQGRRAEAARETGERIMEATVALFMESGAEPTLDAVAARAGVAMQTVLRRYGSKEGLFAECLARGLSEVSAQRGAITPGDVPGAVRNLIEHYDEWGERSLRLLAMEGSGPTAAQVVASGRALHRDWVATAFAPQLEGRGAAERRRRLAQLVTVTDVYAWKLLRRDQGLSRAQTRLAITELVEAVLSATREPARSKKRGATR